MSESFIEEIPTEDGIKMVVERRGEMVSLVAIIWPPDILAKILHPTSEQGNDEEVSK